VNAGSLGGVTRVVESRSAVGIADTSEVYLGVVKIEKGKRVRVRVHLAVKGGATLEKSVVEYIQGSGKMLPGLENVLAGLEKGAKKEGVIKAKDAFGDPSMHLSKKMAKAEFPAGVKVEAGEQFAAKGVNGQEVILKIEKVAGDEVDVRLVHPLADKDITFEVEVLQVTDPAPPPMPAQALKLEDG
jgi:FKBP-type peptidyl-prolyl cis-trans isomerase SlyD